MTVYVKELKEEFFQGGEINPYETRHTIFGYFLDMESCVKDAEMEDAFYSSRGNYSTFFKQGIRLVLNTSVQSGSIYTKLSFTWTPKQLLEVNHRGLGAEDFEAEGKKVEIRRIVGNRDMKIGELDWEQMDEYDDVDYFLKTINDRLETDNMPDGYGIYMMEPKKSMKAEELASEFTGMKRDSKRDYARRGMKRHYERMGMIPSPIGLAAYRRKIEVPKGFKYAQLGFLALVFGALTVNEMRKRE